MAFSDPQTITVNAVAKVMPKTQSSGSSTLFTINDDTWRLFLSHQMTKSPAKFGQHIRSLIRFEQRKVVTNPIDSTQSDFDSQSFSVIYDRPQFGFTQTEGSDMLTGFKTWLTTTVFGQVFGREL